MKSALGVRFPERTKGRTTAGLRHQRGIPAHGLPENRRPSHRPPAEENRDIRASGVHVVLKQSPGPRSHQTGPAAGGPSCFNFMLHQRSKLTAELKYMSLSQKITPPLLIRVIANPPK